MALRPDGNGSSDNRTQAGSKNKGKDDGAHLKRRIEQPPDHSGSADNVDFTGVASVAEPRKPSGTGGPGPVVIHPDSSPAATASPAPRQSQTKIALINKSEPNGSQINASQKVESDDKQTVSSASYSSLSKRSSMVMS
ncbi:hypothetical protein FGIG_02067 [Fasciola gigantica]|uniref:Uncharacterized protein n=1 Tax=Fasciola gigantica TaxID=46835 RepID=A0A504YXU9_FASGI|nr:hypothetical protein FGIG_02067 [Fasciola gigantica]